MKVLVLGRRRSLEACLDARAVPFVRWPDEAPFPKTREAVAKILERVAAEGPFTHCIAAVEAAVVAASHARRVLGARRSPHTIALRCHDKLLMKEKLRAAGVPVADFADLSRPEGRRRALELGRPLVVKDRKSSGSRGIEMITEGRLDPEALRSRGRMAERFVTGAEASVESFVHDGKIVWSSTTLYWRPKHVNVVPSGLPPERLEEVLAANAAALEALAVSWGMTHLELFLTENGCVVGEVGLRPPGGYIMRCLALAYGFDPWDAFCAVELGEVPPLPDGSRSVPTAVIVLHPGEGRVEEIRGLEAVRSHPAHVDTKVKVAVGDRIEPRVGVGDDVGRVFLQAATHEELDAAIRFVEATLEIRREG